MKKALWIIPVAVVVIGIFVIYQQGGPNIITDYGRTCNQQNVTVGDCKSWNLFETTYILDKSKETATWFDGSGDAQRINCHITDNQNWWCDTYEGTALQGNGQNVIGFAGGKSIESTPANPADSTQHFGIIKYWWFKLISAL